jgi:hypothetical protein
LNFGQLGLPCLSAVPHLNNLHDNFKNREDLLFLSMTYEKAEKIKRTRKKIPFNTVVVSDQTKLNETNFNVDEIPHTVLIDNKGIIRWIGIPELNSSIIENLLNGKHFKATFDWQQKEARKVSEEKNQQTVQISL